MGESLASCRRTAGQLVDTAAPAADIQHRITAYRMLPAGPDTQRVTVMHTASPHAFPNLTYRMKQRRVVLMTDTQLAELPIPVRNDYLDRQADTVAEDRADPDNVPDDAWQTGQDRYEASFRD
jgi:hypothetical protein